MLEDKLHFFALVLVIYLPITFAITYTIAVCVGHVDPGFPYISDTGTLPPESCVFGQLLNIGAVIGGCPPLLAPFHGGGIEYLNDSDSLCWRILDASGRATHARQVDDERSDEDQHVFCLTRFTNFTSVVVVYIRYRQVATFYRNSGRTSLLRTNTATFVLGLITAFGVSLVGNFQETSVIAVHLIGAFMAFAIGGLYCYFQTGLSFVMKTDLPGSSIFLAKLRLALCILDFVLLITLLLSSMFAGGNDDRMKWKPHEPGYAEHLVSTISEWLIAIVTVAFFTTFYKEFRRIRLTCPKLLFDEIETKPQTETNRYNAAFTEQSTRNGTY